MTDPIRLEVDQFALKTYRKESNSLASNGSVISFIGNKTNESGTATTTLNFSGIYDIYLGYVDENDGSANLQVLLGGSTLANVLLDQDLGDSGFSSSTLIQRQIASNVSIQNGQTLQIYGKENVWEYARVDYIEFVPVASSTPDPTLPLIPTSDTSIRIEAESTTLFNYRVETNNVASNAGLISLRGVNSGVTGRASFNFSGDAGAYDVYLGYFDETDGVGTLQVSANGQAIANLNLNQNLGSANPDAQTLVRQNIASNVSLTNGQTIQISGIGDAGDYARVDYIEFVPVNASPSPTPTPTPIPSEPEITGELKKWHTIDLTFDGPQTSETDANNPFLNYRLDVTFTCGDTTYVVPGYYAADGNASETSASAGNKWRVHFTPDQAGTWTYSVSFRQGTNVAVSLDPTAGNPTTFDGMSGSFTIGESDKTGADFRGKGRLQYVDERYLQFAETSEYFIKAGANSPENFLAYYQFDNTTDYGGSSNSLTNGLHQYAPHVSDWQEGDPTWQNGEGKGIIGALNYLASEDMNAVYFLTYNTNGGDGSDVFPWIDPNQRTRFDVSKLEQWDIVFSHMDELGIMLHLVTQETENDQALGGLSTERMLYYRELVARFGHHLAVQWNLGEENTNTEEERIAFADYIRAIDPYNHPIGIHTVPWEYQSTFLPLMGNNVEAASFQIAKDDTSLPNKGHDRILEIINASTEQGTPWVVTLDEVGPYDVGVAPDSVDPNHNRPRQEDLWGTLMAGGAGVEWYFGYAYANDDLDAENWRSRDLMWDQTRYALDFFQTYLPFWEMQSADDLTSITNDYVFARESEIYVVYLPNGGTTDIALTSGDYTVQWYNPRTGGSLRTGTVSNLSGGQAVAIGLPPSDTTQDWVALIQNTNNAF